MGNDTGSDSDLALTPEEAEGVLGGVRKKAHKVTGHESHQGLTAPGSTESTNSPGPPSPLGPEPEESYMDTNP